MPAVASRHRTTRGRRIAAAVVLTIAIASFVIADSRGPMGRAAILAGVAAVVACSAIGAWLAMQARSAGRDVDDAVERLARLREAEAERRLPGR